MTISTPPLSNRGSPIAEHFRASPIPLEEDLTAAAVNEAAQEVLGQKKSGVFQVFAWFFKPFFRSGNAGSRTCRFE